MSRWAAAKAGAIASLWPVAPRWLDRYIDGMSSARAQSAAGKS